MRRVTLDTAQSGMVLSKAILGGTGQVLLKAGTEIKPQYLVYLKRLGINDFYVQDSRIADVQVDDIVSDKTRHKARSLVKTVMKYVESPGLQKLGINVSREIIQTVSKIIEELMSNKELIVQLIDIRTKADYLFAHSVNCSILAAIVATKLNYNSSALKCLATGALLHDIGMVAIPSHITSKPGPLTDDEYETVKNHPLYGYEIFKKSSIYNARSGAVILQHHERIRGQGYPQGLKGDKINPLAQIAGIANVYDALTSERPYRKSYYPHEVVEMLMSWGGDHFDMTILTQFLSVIAAYPIGFHVFLSNRESGLVVANNPGFTLRPTVRVLYTGEDLAPHPAPYDLDLSQFLDLTITKVLD